MWTLRTHISAYLDKSELSRAGEFAQFMKNPDTMIQVAFLVDIFGHLNNLNLKLQGQKKSLSTCRKAVKTFQSMLLVYKNDIEKDKVHFPTLKEYATEFAQDADMGLFVDFIVKLIAEFDSRFTVFNSLDAILLVVTQPFRVNVMDELWQTQAAAVFPHLTQLQRQLIDLQADDELELEFNRDQVEEIWIGLDQSAFPELRTMAVNLLTIFGSTYICEQCFSNINFIENKYRNRITNRYLDNITRIATTSLEPNFSAIAQAGKCNFSH